MALVPRLSEARTPDDLLKVAQHGSYRDRMLLAQLPEPLPPAAEAQLARDAEEDVVLLLAQRPRLSHATLLLLAQHPSAAVRERIAGRADAPAPLLATQLANDADPRVRAAALGNRTCPRDVVWLHARDASPLVRRAIVARGVTAAMAQFFLRDKDPEVRGELATQEIPESVGDALAQDADPRVRAMFALFGRHSPRQRELLERDPASAVQHALETRARMGATATVTPSAAFEQVVDRLERTVAERYPSVAPRVRVMRVGGDL